jgi:hypothetical protein
MDVPGHPAADHHRRGDQYRADIGEKADIIRNAIDLAHVIEIERPRSRSSPLSRRSIPPCSRRSMRPLCKMADRGQITGGLLDGPLAFDNAISEAAAKEKGIVSPVAGKAEILVVPDIEAGNMLAKQLTFLGGADAAGVLGARVPIILTSRADSLRTRLASCAVAVLLAAPRRRRLRALRRGRCMRAVVALNSGSSSIKFALFTLDEKDRPELSAGGKIEKIGIAPRLSIRTANGETSTNETGNRAQRLAMQLLEYLFFWAGEHCRATRSSG